MDWIAQKQRAGEVLKKYGSVALVVLLGIFLLTLPTEASEEPGTTADVSAGAEPQLQEQLAELLSGVSGAGKVEVLLTQAQGEETLYQEQQRITDSETSRDTVVLSGPDRGEFGLIRQVNPPVYQGAVILCQGADSPQVKLAMVEAVKCATGLTADRITVLKMK